jgi:hypothetical protein
VDFFVVDVIFASLSQFSTFNEKSKKLKNFQKFVTHVELHKDTFVLVDVKTGIKIEKWKKEKLNQNPKPIEC